MGATSQITIPVARFRNSIFPWQREDMAAFDDGRARFAHIVCHRRARKTSMAVNLLIRECIAHPRSIYRYIAPTRTEAKAIVWADPNMLFRFLPPSNIVPWKANSQDLEIRFKNGSLLKLEGADKISQSHRGKASDGLIFDEWSYHEDPTVWSSVFRPVIAEDEEKWAWFLMTPNGTNHAYEMFQQAQECGLPDVYTRLLKASTSGILPQAELERARLEMPHSLYMQEFECEWLVSNERVLIQPAALERLRTLHPIWTEGRRIIACDPAFAGDECVSLAMENGRILEMEILHPHTTEEIVGALQVMGNRHDTHDYIVDSIGYGKGTLDGLRTDERNEVQEFDSRHVQKVGGATSRRFANHRAEAWWYAMEQIVGGRVVYPEDPELRRQLCGVRYRMRGGMALGMELKEETRKHLKRSPDRADAFVMGLWGLQNVEARTAGRISTRREYAPAAARGGAMVA
ncbi:hypothetical protein D4Q85_00580 [bacterium]|nr:MAG: hypothetical protein D4Q85_00580 [bacterium]